VHHPLISIIKKEAVRVANRFFFLQKGENPAEKQKIWE